MDKLFALTNVLERENALKINVFVIKTLYMLIAHLNIVLQIAVAVENATKDIVNASLAFLEMDANL